MGRDHTIYATECGYVKYYKDPELHPKRQYIGVTFERDQVLPLPRNSVRRRRLGMVAQKIESGVTVPDVEMEFVDGKVRPIPADAFGELETEVTKLPKTIKVGKMRKGEEGRNLTLRPGYMFRESNWEIGRAAERANVTAKKFKSSDRWASWRKSAVAKKEAATKRSLAKRGGKKKG
jgi:large subunit ribosomal protein L27